MGLTWYRLECTGQKDMRWALYLKQQKEINGEVTISPARAFAVAA